MKPFLYVTLFDFFKPPFVNQPNPLHLCTLDKILYKSNASDITITLAQLKEQDVIDHYQLKDYYLCIILPMPMDTIVLLSHPDGHRWFGILETILMTVFSKYPDCRIITGNDWDEYNVAESQNTDFVKLFFNYFRKHNISLSRLTWLYSNVLVESFIEKRVTERPPQSFYYSSYLPRLKNINKIYNFEENLLATKTSSFLCLNRMARFHRVYLSWYWFNNKKTKSYWSCRLTNHNRDKKDSYYESIESYETLVSNFKGKFSLSNYQNFVKSLPWTFDQSDNDIFAQILQDTIPKIVIEDTACYIVTETHFNQHNTENAYNYLGWFSEKSLKAFMWGMPAIFVSTPYTLQHLKKIGFETFSPLINEEYDTEENSSIRMEMILTEIQRIQYINNFTLWYQEGIEIYKHNYNNLCRLWDRNVLQLIEDFHIKNLQWDPV